MHGERKRLSVLALHGLVLGALNLLAICAGFVAWNLVRPVDQLLVQVPVAVVLTLLLFAAWTLSLARRLGPGHGLDTTADAVLVFLAALITGPALFVPLHLATQGYWTAPSNVLALLAFQVPVDLAAIALARMLTVERARSV